MIVGRTTWAQFTSVTDGWTVNRYTMTKRALCIASRGKKNDGHVAETENQWVNRN